MFLRIFTTTSVVSGIDGELLVRSETSSRIEIARCLSQACSALQTRQSLGEHMTKLVPLTYGGGLYDRTVRLYTGQVRPVGIDLTYMPMGFEDLFWRQSRNAEFDACEYSTGAYLASVEDPAWGYVALPVFPSRVFRHSAIFVHADSGIRSPKDLEGRAIGTPEWSMTASLWARGILGEHYGVDLTKVQWRTGGLDTPGRHEKSRVTPPARFSVKHIGPSDTLKDALLDRRIDAIVSGRPPASFVGGHPKIRRLFEDCRGEERAYYQATGIFPIMHTVLVRKSLVEAYPWLAGNLRNAFEDARAPALLPLLDVGINTTSLMWETSYAEEERALFGDAFVYGVEQNKAALAAMLRYAFEQGFTSRLLEPRDIFATTTLTSARI
jgi:4,5-dihydroxyphthalate decarboxylase